MKTINYRPLIYLSLISKLRMSIQLAFKSSMNAMLTQMEEQLPLLTLPLQIKIFLSVLSMEDPGLRPLTSLLLLTMKLLQIKHGNL